MSTIFTNFLIRWASYHCIWLWSMIMCLLPSKTSLVSKWGRLSITWACDSSKNDFSAALLTPIFLLMFVAKAVLAWGRLFHVAIFLGIAILNVDSTTFKGLFFVRGWRDRRTKCWTRAATRVKNLTKLTFFFLQLLSLLMYVLKSRSWPLLNFDLRSTFSNRWCSFILFTS